MFIGIESSMWIFGDVRELSAFKIYCMLINKVTKCVSFEDASLIIMTSINVIFICIITLVRVVKGNVSVLLNVWNYRNFKNRSHQHFTATPPVSISAE